MGLLIDRFLPSFQFAEHHQQLVRADSAAQVLEAVEQVIVRPDPWIERLIAVREWPARSLAKWLSKPALAPVSFGYANFTRLGKTEGEEIAFGLAGRFWQLDYGLLQVRDANHFEEIQGPPKLVMNFQVAPENDLWLLSTQTRVHCPSPEDLNRFRLYWLLIRPASGLIRRRLLSKIAAEMRISPLP